MHVAFSQHVTGHSWNASVESRHTDTVGNLLEFLCSLLWYTGKIYPLLFLISIQSLIVPILCRRQEHQIVKLSVWCADLQAVSEVYEHGRGERLAICLSRTSKTPNVAKSYTASVRGLYSLFLRRTPGISVGLYRSECVHDSRTRVRHQHFNPVNRSIADGCVWLASLTT